MNIQLQSPICAVAGLGMGEIILLLIVGLFFLAFFCVIVFLIYWLFKRKDSKSYSNFPPNINIPISIPASVTSQPKPDIQNENTALAAPKEKIALPQQHEIRYVFVNEITRCEADDNYTNFFLTNGDKILISKSLKEYADLLKPHGFLRPHQSHLINPSYVKSWLKEDGGVLLMKNGDKIPVSKPNRETMKFSLGSGPKSLV